MSGSAGNHLKVELRRLKRGLDGGYGFDLTRFCAGCWTRLGRILRRGLCCEGCGKRVCKSCRHFLDERKWICVLCYKKKYSREEWWHDDANVQRFKGTQGKTGTYLLRLTDWTCHAVLDTQPVTDNNLDRRFRSHSEPPVRSPPVQLSPGWHPKSKSNIYYFNSPAGELDAQLSSRLGRKWKLKWKLLAHEAKTTPSDEPNLQYTSSTLKRKRREIRESSRMSARTIQERPSPRLRDELSPKSAPPTNSEESKSSNAPRARGELDYYNFLPEAAFLERNDFHTRLSVRGTRVFGRKKSYRPCHNHLDGSFRGGAVLRCRSASLPSELQEPECHDYDFWNTGFVQSRVRRLEEDLATKYDDRHLWSCDYDVQSLCSLELGRIVPDGEDYRIAYLSSAGTSVESSLDYIDDSLSAFGMGTLDVRLDKQFDTSTLDKKNLVPRNEDWDLSFSSTDNRVSPSSDDEDEFEFFFPESNDEAQMQPENTAVQDVESSNDSPEMNNAPDASANEAELCLDEGSEINNFMAFNKEVYDRKLRNLHSKAKVPEDMKVDVTTSPELDLTQQPRTKKDNFTMSDVLIEVTETQNSSNSVDDSHSKNSKQNGIPEDRKFDLTINKTLFNQEDKRCKDIDESKSEASKPNGFSIDYKGSECSIKNKPLCNRDGSCKDTSNSQSVSSSVNNRGSGYSIIYKSRCNQVGNNHEDTDKSQSLYSKQNSLPTEIKRSGPSIRNKPRFNQDYNKCKDKDDSESKNSKQNGSRIERKTSGYSIRNKSHTYQYCNTCKDADKSESKSSKTNYYPETKINKKSGYSIRNYNSDNYQSKDTDESESKSSKPNGSTVERKRPGYSIKNKPRCIKDDNWCKKFETSKETRDTMVDLFVYEPLSTPFAEIYAISCGKYLPDAASTQTEVDDDSSVEDKLLKNNDKILVDNSKSCSIIPYTPCESYNTEQIKAEGKFSSQPSPDITIECLDDVKTSEDPDEKEDPHVDLLTESIKPISTAEGLISSLLKINKIDIDCILQLQSNNSPLLGISLKYMCATNLFKNNNELPFRIDSLILSDEMRPFTNPNDSNHLQIILSGKEIFRSTNFSKMVKLPSMQNKNNNFNSNESHNNCFCLTDNIRRNCDQEICKSINLNGIQNFLSRDAAAIFSIVEIKVGGQNFSVLLDPLRNTKLHSKLQQERRVLEHDVYLLPRNQNYAVDLSETEVVIGITSAGENSESGLTESRHRPTSRTSPAAFTEYLPSQQNTSVLNGHIFRNLEGKR